MNKMSPLNPIFIPTDDVPSGIQGPKQPIKEFIPKQRGYGSKLFNKMKSSLDNLISASQKIQNDISQLKDKVKKVESSKQNHKMTAKKGKYEEEIKGLCESLAFVEIKMPAKIFEMESRMRNFLEKSFPEKEKYQDIYLQKVLPLVQEVKQSISQSALQFTAQAAAAKGKAVQAGLQALRQLAEDQPVIQSSEISSQEVFLLPKEGAVFKHLSERAKEEERLANDLFDLMSNQAVVGTFNIQQASADKFGFQFSEEVQIRGFTSEDLSKLPRLREGIRQKLSDHDRLILEKHETTPPTVDASLENYEKMKKQIWYIKFPKKDKNWKSVSLSNLQKLNLAQKLPANALIGTAPELDKALSFQDHLLKETEFARALNYLPALHNSPKTLYFSPDLSHPAIRNAYETCEKYQWRYLDGNGKSCIVDFKRLHTLFLQNTKMLGFLRPMQNHLLLPHSYTYYFHNLAKKALCINWKVASPELMHIDTTGSLASLSDIQAKPFIDDMILMHHLNSRTREAILQRLTPDAEFNAILTGEVQLLDMHAKNLGVAPQSNAEYERYKNLQFSTSSDAPISFKDLIIKYLRGSIKPTTVIEFKEGMTTVKKPLKDLTELQKALDVRWQLIIFDTDLSLSEDNRLQLQMTSSGIEQHLIPLRSILLETNWKNRPLSNETIQHLMNSSERDLRVANWIKRADAPIYKQLFPPTRQSLEQQLAPLIQRYSLSEPRKNHPDIETTVKSLQDEFIQDLSDITQFNRFTIWLMLEQDLSSVTVLPHDTWKKIAQRHHQDLNELKTLNPERLKAGQKIKIKYDLTSFDPEAVKKREKIAAQLFPRLTHRQQAALVERQQSRKDYLSNYQTLSQSNLTGKELIDQMKQYLQRTETPLSSVRKERILNQLKAREKFFLGHPNRLLNLKQIICQQCQPTYFNLMKAMYPLLADAYALNKTIYDNETLSGRAIGLYTLPLEKMIDDVHNNFLDDSSLVSLAQKLEDQIALIKSPAFFVHLK